MSMRKLQRGRQTRRRPSDDVDCAAKAPAAWRHAGTRDDDLAMRSFQR
jgi:hypothetical protein